MRCAPRASDGPKHLELWSLQVRSNGGVVVRGTSANVLVEGSVIEQSAVGVHVNESTTKGGIVLVNNTEPAGVPANFNPYVPVTKA